MAGLLFHWLVLRNNPCGGRWKNELDEPIRYSRRLRMEMKPVPFINDINMAVLMRERAAGWAFLITGWKMPVILFTPVEGPACTRYVSAGEDLA